MSISVSILAELSAKGPEGALLTQKISGQVPGGVSASFAESPLSSEGEACSTETGEPTWPPPGAHVLYTCPAWGLPFRVPHGLGHPARQTPL